MQEQAARCRFYFTSLSLPLFTQPNASLRAQRGARLAVLELSDQAADCCFGVAINHAAVRCGKQRVF